MSRAYGPAQIKLIGPALARAGRGLGRQLPHDMNRPSRPRERPLGAVLRSVREVLTEGTGGSCLGSLDGRQIGFA